MCGRTGLAAAAKPISSACTQETDFVHVASKCMEESSLMSKVSIVAMIFCTNKKLNYSLRAIIEMK